MAVALSTVEAYTSTPSSASGVRRARAARRSEPLERGIARTQGVRLRARLERQATVSMRSSKGLGEHVFELPAEPGRRDGVEESEVAPQEGRGAPVHGEPEADAIPDGSKDASRVVLKRPLMEDANPPRAQVAEPPLGVEQLAEIAGGERRGHGVDGEVPPREVGEHVAGTYGRQGARAVVPFRTERGQVYRAPAQAQLHGAECRTGADGGADCRHECRRKLARGRGRREVEVRHCPFEQRVAHGAAHEPETHARTVRRGAKRAQQGQVRRGQRTFEWDCGHRPAYLAVLGTWGRSICRMTVKVPVNSYRTPRIGGDCPKMAQCVHS